MSSLNHENEILLNDDNVNVLMMSLVTRIEKVMIYSLLQ